MIVLQLQVKSRSSGQVHGQGQVKVKSYQGKRKWMAPFDSLIPSPPPPLKVNKKKKVLDTKIITLCALVKNYDQNVFL